MAAPPAGCCCCIFLATVCLRNIPHPTFQAVPVLQLPQVLDAVQLSQATFRKIRQNLWWAFGYNLIGIPLAAGALLPSAGIVLTPSISGGLWTAALQAPAGGETACVLLS